MDLNDHGVIRHRQRNAVNICEGLDWLLPDGYIVNPYRSSAVVKIDCNAICTGDLLPPHHQLEYAIASLKQQVMHCGRLIRNRILKLSRACYGNVVAEN